MRRTRFILALVAVAAAVTVADRPAAAHFCSLPIRIAVGKPVTVNVGVAAEVKPVRAVDIDVPDGFRLDDTRRGRDRLHYENLEIASYSCKYFALRGTATRKGRLVVPITTTAIDGTKTRFDDTNPRSQFPAMLIFAGVPITIEVAEDDGGTPIWVGVVAAVVAGVVAVGIAVLLRRRGTMGT